MTFRAVLLVVVLVAAACGNGAADDLRLRHEAKRKLVYRLEQHEEAPHPVVGLGGSLDLGETITLSCLSVDPDGSGQYEVMVQSVKLSAPPATGVAVDTSLGRPVPGDKVGANGTVSSLLPTAAIVVLAPDATVSGVRPDENVATHFREWIKTQSVASRKAIVRLGGALDPGAVAYLWFMPIAGLLPAGGKTPAGNAWRASPPVIETPAGRIRSTLDVTCRREGGLAVLEGKGTFALDGDAPANRPVDFAGASIEATAKIDVARGVLVSYEESSHFDLRIHGGDAAAAPATVKRTLTLVE